MGPTGSGKTELAKQLGNAGGGGGGGSFLKINIGALTEDLLESRLRGFAKGAHSKADKDTPGCFEQAKGGTLFFDEFQNASPAAQVQLLDLLSAVSDEVVISRMGEDHVRRHCRVKVVLAANEPLTKLLEKGRLRHDLYHRVRIVHELPSLAARLRQEGEGDKLLKRLMTIYRWKSNRPVTLSDTTLGVLFPRYDSNILQALKAYNWPGNLRELERVCFDLSWKLEQTGEADLAFLRRLLHRFDSPDVTRERPAASQAVPDSPELARLRRLEVILLEHDLDPVAAAVRLGEVRLKTPHHMKKFLRKHQALLSRNFLEHPRAKRLLTRRARGASARV
jgi:transcriptional regulator with PAS, ATPase and Fis domain